MSGRIVGERILFRPPSAQVDVYIARWRNSARTTPSGDDIREVVVGPTGAQIAITECHRLHVLPLVVFDHKLHRRTDRGLIIDGGIFQGKTNQHCFYGSHGHRRRERFTPVYWRYSVIRGRTTASTSTVTRNRRKIDGREDRRSGWSKAIQVKTQGIAPTEDILAFHFAYGCPPRRKRSGWNQKIATGFGFQNFSTNRKFSFAKGDIVDFILAILFSNHGGIVPHLPVDNGRKEKFSPRCAFGHLHGQAKLPGELLHIRQRYTLNGRT